MFLWCSTIQSNVSDSLPYSILAVSSLGPLVRYIQRQRYILLCYYSMRFFTWHITINNRTQNIARFPIFFSISFLWWCSSFGCFLLLQFWIKRTSNKTTWNMHFLNTHAFCRKIVEKSSSKLFLALSSWINSRWKHFRFLPYDFRSSVCNYIEKKYSANQSFEHKEYRAINVFSKWTCLSIQLYYLYLYEIWYGGHVCVALTTEKNGESNVHWRSLGI